MPTYEEVLEKDYARQIKFNHVEEYHKLGYEGKGITILNAESLSDHCKMTTKVLNDYAPEATVITSNISGRTSNDKVIETTVTINGEKIDFEKAIDKYNIKIVTHSYSGSISDARLNYFKGIQKHKGIIFFCSAGNDGDEGITGMETKYNTAIAVGAVYITKNNEIKLENYSSRGEELDFVSFLARGVGTSAASPALAAMTALLLQRYGDFNQEQCIEILKSLCIDLGSGGKDNNFGYGLPILPLTDKIEIIDKLKGADEMQFKDVTKGEWYYDEIEKAVNEGLVKGYDDGNFKPNNSVTRAEQAVIANRILEKVRLEISKQK